MLTHSKTDQHKSTHHATRPFFGKASNKQPSGSFFTQTSALPAIQKKCAACEKEQKIQTKLTIGQSDDQYEREADAIADRVVNTSEADIQRQQENEEEEEVQAKLFPGQSELPIQRQTESEEKEEEIQAKPLSGESGLRIQRQAEEENEEEAIQTKAKSTSQAAVGPNIANAIKSTQSSGQALTGSTRHFFESSFGRDFSDVRIHTDSRANHLARSINARAFTHKSEIYFNSGEYQPHTREGQRLLAHELAHVVQQNNSDISPKIQCDFAIAPTHPNTPLAVLTPQQVQEAISYNNILFTDADEISVIRDVLGISRTPAVIDNDFVSAVLEYQSLYDLGQDGKLGSGTCGILYNEVKAEADYLAEPASGTPLRRVERRLYLRSRVPRRRGVIAHQGFVGPDDRPRGVVTVRINANESALHAAANRAITLDYTGSDANNVNWLQFINRSYYGYQPGSRNRTYHTGNITTTGGNYALSRPGAITWNLDTASAASPFYNAGGLSVRTANRSIVMIDQPGNVTPAMRNAFTTANPNLNRLVMQATFDAYAVLNNSVIYRVRWYATYTSNEISPGVWSVSTVRYSLGTAGMRSTLISAQRAVLRGRFAGNTIR